MGDNGRIRVANPPQSSVALWGDMWHLATIIRGGYLGGGGNSEVPYIRGRLAPPQSSVALWGGYVAFGDDNQGGI